MEMSLLRTDDAMSYEDFAWTWRACEIQWREHFLPAWKGCLFVPAAAKWTVSGFTNSRDLAPGSHFPIQVVKDTGDPGVLGDHTGLRVVWKAFGRATPGSESHEVLEMGADPFLDGWASMPGRDDQEAIEVCDRVQFDRYDVNVTIGTENRWVSVSNFLRPEAFGLFRDTGVYDYMGLLRSPNENRGYRIVRKANGRIVNEFAADPTAAVAAALRAAEATGATRTGRRCGKVTP